MSETMKKELKLKRILWANELCGYYGMAMMKDEFFVLRDIHPKGYVRKLPATG